MSPKQDNLLVQISFKFAFFGFVARQILSNLDAHAILRKSATVFLESQKTIYKQLRQATGGRGCIVDKHWLLLLIC
jgi:hypothetical protein